jgi:hypothetical protein
VTAHRRRSRRPAPMVRAGATVLRPLSFGPKRRPAGHDALQRCVCGIEFTTYWSHRQTTQHKRMQAAVRATARADRRQVEHMTEPAVAA